MPRSAAPLAFLVALACTPTGGTGEDFVGGDFDVETTGVDDDCYDGSFEVIFLPDGGTSTNPWGQPVYLPGFAELPATYQVELPDPFEPTEVTVTGDADHRVVTGAPNDQIALDAEQWPGCLVDMSIDVDLLIVSADEVQGTATLHTASFDEASCPAVQADPCDITLDLRGTRR